MWNHGSTWITALGMLPEEGTEIAEA